MAVKFFEQNLPKEKDVFIRLERAGDESNVAAYLCLYDKRGMLIGDILHIYKDGSIERKVWGSAAAEKIKSFKVDSNGFVIMEQ